jgi:ABC-type Zn uptake system ZnuABC Zn-binding protein ZnuA
VVTTTVAADLTRAVAGESAQVTSLLPAGVDPHAYEPAPQDVRTVAEADAVFINGLGLEEFLAELLANAGGGAPVVSLSEGVQPRALEDLGLGEEHNEEEAHSVDPHVWLDPVLMITWADNIGEALAALDLRILRLPRAGKRPRPIPRIPGWVDSPPGRGSSS